MRLRFDNSNALLRLMAASLFCFVAISSTAVLPAQVIKDGEWPSPLMDEEPFDLLYLDQSSDNVVIKIVPTENLKRPFPNKGQFQFEYYEESEYILQVPYGNIATYVTFNELLLDEAEEFLGKREYAAALRNLLYVYDNGGRTNENVRHLRVGAFNF